MNIVFYLCASITACLFMLAGTAKLSNPTEYAAAVNSWRLGYLTPRSAPIRGLPYAEMVVALAIVATCLSGRLESFALGAAVLLLVVFLTGQSVLKVRVASNGARCGCFGTRGRVGRRSIGRTVALLALAIVALTLAVV